MMMRKWKIPSKNLQRRKFKHPKHLKNQRLIHKLLKTKKLKLRVLIKRLLQKSLKKDKMLNLKLKPQLVRSNLNHHLNKNNKYKSQKSFNQQKQLKWRNRIHHPLLLDLLLVLMIVVMTVLLIQILKVQKVDLHLLLQALILAKSRRNERRRKNLNERS